ncbi:MAG: efflux RND transporter permease subunit [Deltaproteobacteria bacterium]|nr:MAG: efflux RND transporter permease subunit [Deltaproteobacteria bacterium]
MSLSRTAVRRPVATAMVFVALTVLGAFAFMRLQVDLFPSVDFPTINVITSYAGVAPEEIETLITRPIEGAVARVEGVDRLESTSLEGRSRVALRFDWGKDLETATNDVRAAVDRVRDALPDDAGAPIIFKFDIANFPIMNLALAADGMDEGRIRRFAEDVVRPRLERIVGVADVEVRGAREREIRIEVDPERLAGLGLTLQDVTAGLRAENLTVPAGVVRQPRENILIRAMGEIESLEELTQVVLTRRDGVPIRVADIGILVDGFSEVENIVRINGTQGVQLVIRKSPDANTVEVADLLYDAIDRFNRDFEDQARISIIVDSSTFIRDSIDGVLFAISIGGFLAILVLLFFLQSVRATIVVGVTIPIAAISTFLLMQQFDLTLNLISFGGLAVGLGMLVDNAIVILENIYRHREAGEDPEEAAIVGAEEVASAITASTMTTLAVFVPVLFLGGFAAVFFSQMALVVTAALLCSLFAALTLVPVLSSVLLRRVGREEDESRNAIRRALDHLDRLYSGFVHTCLRFPLVVIGVSVALLAGAIHLFADVGRELLPESDEGEVRIMAEYPSGTRVEVTEAAVLRIEALIAEHVPEAADVLSTLGTPGFWSSSGEESASIRLNLVPHGERTRSSEEVAAALRPILARELPGMRVFARPGTGLWIFNFIRGGDERVRVEIRGFDMDTAELLMGEVRGLLGEVDGVTDVRSSRRAGGREVRMFVDREAAADLGLTTRQVVEGISMLVGGGRAGVFREGGDEFEIRVRLRGAELHSPERLLEVPFRLPDGGVVALGDLVRTEDGETPRAIERLGQERIVWVGASLDGTRTLGEINDDVRDRLRELDIPDDFSVLVAGEGDEQQRTFGALGLGLLLAMLLVYMIMAGQFESFLHPVIIMSSIPFAFIGAVASLLFFGATLNINSFMGVIVLVGVVANNAIVLVDYINLMRRKFGYALREAVVESARRRLRPILMTTLTTTLALSPIALATGAGSENQGPLAQVVIGGLLSSTAISLMLVPVLYYNAERLRGWLAGRLKLRAS